MPAETKRIDGKACVSTALLCEYFAVTRQALNLWEKKGCPKAARGYWCVSDILRWRDESGAHPEDQRVEDLPLTQQKIYWETRCREEQAENQSFKNAVIRGDYLEKAQAEKDLTTFFGILKQSVLSLPRKAAITAAQYIGNDRARGLEKDLTEVMTDALAQWNRGNFAPRTANRAVDRRGADRPEAAGKNNGKPVGGRKKSPGQKEQQ